MELGEPKLTLSPERKKFSPNRALRQVTQMKKSLCANLLQLYQFLRLSQLQFRVFKDKFREGVFVKEGLTTLEKVSPSSTLI